MSRKFERFRVYNVDICGRDCENDAIRFRNIFGDEIPRLLLDVRRLVANRNLKRRQSLPTPSPGTLTFVNPGRSTRVKFRTCGEKIFRLMGCRLMPLLLPAIRAVSASISRLTSVKSYHFLPRT